MTARFPHWTVAASLAAFTAACGAADLPAEKVELPGPPAAPVTATSEVPVVAAQAIAVRARIDDGLSAETLASLKIGQILAVDFQGRPAQYLVFTAAVALDAPWELASWADETLWRGTGDEGPWSTTIVGANATRGTVSMTAHGLDLLVNLGKASAAAGGSRRVVAANPLRYLIQTDAGDFYEVATAQKLEQSDVEALKGEHGRAREAVAAQGLGEAQRAAWAPLLAGGHEKYAGRGGGLDVEKAAVELAPILSDLGPRRGQTSLSNTTTSCKKVLWWTDCTTTEEGWFGDAARKQAHRALQQRAYTVSGCLGGSVSNTWQGCGPAAIIALVWREWADGASFTGLQAYNGEAFDGWWYGGAASIEASMSAELPRLMSSCAVPGNQGTMTTPWGFVDGTKAWLARHNPALKLGHTTSYLVGNLTDGGDKLSILRDRVQQERGPVVALINVGGLTSYHYTPVSRYRAKSSTSIVVQGFDQGQSTGGWYSLTDPWIAATGLYWLSR